MKALQKIPNEFLNITVILRDEGTRDEGTVLLAPISAFISSFSFPFAERFSIFEIKVAIINPNSKNKEKDMRDGKIPHIFFAFISRSLYQNLD